MLRKVFSRLVSVVPVLFIVALATFALLELSPGDPAQTLAGEDATAEDVQRVREELGLDRPVWERFGAFLLRAVQGDFGSSLSNSKPVLTTILEALPITLSLMLLVLVISALVAIPLGIAAGLKANSLLDRVVAFVTSVGLATPSFLLGLILVVLFTFQIKLFPATGYVPIGDDAGRWLWHLALPAIALASTPISELTRMTRGSVHEVLEQDYMRTAWAKGLLPRQVIIKHALRNALIPAVTTFGLLAARVVGGTLIIEKVFNIPGLGTLTINAVLNQDGSMLMGVVLFVAFAVVLINLLVDLSYMLLNPRLRT